MTALWLAAGAMALAVGFALAWPLIRRSGGEPPRTAYDVRVFKDQLDEVERDRTRGLLDEREAQAARTEIERRLLATSEIDTTEADRPAPGGRIAAIVVGAAVPLAALAFYLVLGQPQAPDQPYAARDLEREQRLARDDEGAGEAPPGMADAIAQLERRLAETPDDLRGWLLLARSYQSTGDVQAAARAWRRAMEVSGGHPEIATSYVEAATMANGGEIPGEARELLPKIVADDPINLKARYFQGLAQAQQGELRQALQTWIDLRAMSPQGAPWLEVVDSQIARAAEDSETDPATIQPTAEAKQLAERVAEELAAQPDAPADGTGPATAPPITEEQRRAVQEMSPEQRQQMIRGMVDRLAQRLEETPDDLEGWQRLARAYEVLGETEKAAEARMRAEMLERQAR